MEISIDFFVQSSVYCVYVLIGIFVLCCIILYYIIFLLYMWMINQINSNSNHLQLEYKLTYIKFAFMSLLYMV